MLLKITCDKCKERSEMNMYLTDSEIKTEEHYLELTRSYTAMVRGRAICPDCGHTIDKYFSAPIYTNDIIDLALRRETKA